MTSVGSDIGRRQHLPKASDLLAEDIRGRIIGEGLEAGTPLPSEGDLIKELGLSRATVREALRLLEADGLIAIKRGPGGGIVVRHPEGAQVTRSLALMLALAEAPLRDLFAFRKTIEPAAAAAAAENASDEQRRRLNEVIDPASRVDFHILVAEMSGNALYKLNLAVLHDLIDWHVRAENLSEADVKATVEVHERIAGAIIDGDASAAERLMLRHLESFEAVMAAAGRLDQPIIPREQWLHRQEGFRRGSTGSGNHRTW
jgi:GntR family transcriptional regulator, transcriptional repressor for pyruvate dehydrogenase complex